MGNMSYCRWENTSRDLAECVDTFEEWIDECETPDLSSEYEVDGFTRCIRQARKLVSLADGNPDIVEEIENQRK